MNAKATKETALLENTLSALRHELSRLADRVDALEARLNRPAAPGQSVSASGPDEELLAAISAAVAAYLGCKPHIRQVRLVGSTSWVQYGRLTIQASHNISSHQA